MKNIIGNITLKGFCSYNLKKNYRLLTTDNSPYNESVLSLNMMNIKKLTYDNECQLITIVFFRHYPIVNSSDKIYDAGCEFDGESVEVTIKYCLFSNSITSALIEPIPGNKISNIQLISQLSLYFQRT